MGEGWGEGEGWVRVRVRVRGGMWHISHAVFSHFTLHTTLCHT